MQDITDHLTNSARSQIPPDWAPLVTSHLQDAIQHFAEKPYIGDSLQEIGS